MNCGRVEPDAVFPELRRLAASDQWQTREVAATALVQIGKRHPVAVLETARRWAKDHDANVRRAASEGLRGDEVREMKMGGVDHCRLKAVSSSGRVLLSRTPGSFGFCSAIIQYTALRAKPWHQFVFLARSDRELQLFD